MNSTRILRDRQSAILASADRLGAFGEDGGIAILAQTTTLAAYPTDAGSFYACIPLLIDGDEVEGASASFIADPLRTIYAYNLGTQVPPVNTKVLLHACGGRWTFRHDG
jgi:hypothetical protein